VPVLRPVRVRVAGAVLLEKTIAEVLLKVMVLAAVALEESKVAVPALPMVKRRSVVCAEAPRYCSVPPLMIRFAAALLDLPMPLFEPPNARVLTLSVPALMVVAPV